MPVLNRLRKFANKRYRDSFMRTQVLGGIAYQIQALRQKFGMTQVEFAEKTGKKQSTVSRLENTEYGTVNVKTLLDIASSLDVALLVRFVSYPEFLRYAGRMSEGELQVSTIHESLQNLEAEGPANFYENWNRMAEDERIQYPERVQREAAAA